MSNLYLKKPIPVEAIQFEEKAGRWVEILEFTNQLVRYSGEPENPDILHFFVFDRLHDTWVEFYLGDWIIKGTKGEFYPHNGELFLENYEKAEDNVERS